LDFELLTRGGRWLHSLDLTEEVTQGHLQRVGDALRGHDARSVIAPLDLSEVTPVHRDCLSGRRPAPWDAVRDSFERLLPLVSDPTDGGSERRHDRIRLGSATRQQAGGEGRTRPRVVEPTRHVRATRHVYDLRRVLGIDLGGARMRTTGVVLLEGADRARVADARTLPKYKTAEQAERALLDVVEDAQPDVVAIDAPLTLPPCLSCPSFCRGPSADLCELSAARAVWSEGGHPVTERLCEVRLRGELDAGPLPTMRIAQIAARGTALARRILAGGTRLEPGRVAVLEVYPYASMFRLGKSDAGLRPRAPGEADESVADRVLAALRSQIDVDPAHRAALDGGHALDALVAAWTGWLHPHEVEHPPPGFNAAAGWIWLPRIGA
jgi:predicted nuclease with RNAse H fold